MSTLVSLVAIISADGFISRDRGVPWDLPADKAHFRAYTRGKWLLTGRRTYEEMTGWFQPDQMPLVLTRDRGYAPPAGRRVSTFSEALALAAGQPELAVLGGGGAYEAAMPFAGRLVITHVHQILGGGVPFPGFSAHDWEPVTREAHAMDDLHQVSFDITTYQRIRRMERAA